MPVCVVDILKCLSGLLWGGGGGGGVWGVLETPRLTGLPRCSLFNMCAHFVVCCCWL